MGTLLVIAEFPVADIKQWKVFQEFRPLQNGDVKENLWKTEGQS